MKKWFCILALFGMLVGIGAVPAEAEVAVGNNNILLVDGQPIEVYPYNIEGSNYFKVRDMAAALAKTASSFDVGWNESTQSIELTAGVPYSGNAQPAYLRGENIVEAAAVDVPVFSGASMQHVKAYNISGSNYLKIRDMAALLGAEINWNNNTQLMEWISTDATKESGEMLKKETSEKVDSLQEEAVSTSTSEEIRAELLKDEIEKLPPTTLVPQKEEPTEIITDVKQLMNSAVLQPQLTKFGVLNDVILDFMEKNFTDDMDPYTKATVAYDFFIRNMTYGTAKDLDMSLFTKAEAATIWQCYPERYVLPIMQNHVGVCNHYSCAYGAILRAIGYNVEIVSGQTYAAGGKFSNHVWVEVVIGGNHYVFDPQVEQNIAKRYGGVIQYSRFGKPMVNMGGYYKDGKHYLFSED